MYLIYAATYQCDMNIHNYPLPNCKACKFSRPQILAKYLYTYLNINHTILHESEHVKLMKYYIITCIVALKRNHSIVQYNIYTLKLLGDNCICICICLYGYMHSLYNSIIVMKHIPFKVMAIYVCT